MRRRVPASRVIGFVVAISVLLVALVVWQDVPTDLTEADRHYAALILGEAGYGAGFQDGQKPEDFEAQIRAIAATQDAVLRAAPKDEEIPLGRQREPQDLYELKKGLCYDRSRSIEKILTWLGFETRHVAVYSTNEMNAVKALLTPQVPSHAVSEVLTAKGWMLVDSTARWIGLDTQRNPVSLEHVRETKSWAPESSAPIHAIFTASFVGIRGLYSRHGYFYAPFTRVPDFNVGQLLSNVSE